MPKYKPLGSGRDFKPGQSGNPAGRPPNPPEYKEMNLLTKAQLEILVSKVLNANSSELDQFKGTVLEEIVVSIVKRAKKEGDPNRLNPLLDRTIGKVKDQLEISAAERLKAMSDQELIEAARQKILELESKK